jgi:hypothetical protein
MFKNGRFSSHDKPLAREQKAIPFEINTWLLNKFERG